MPTSLTRLKLFSAWGADERCTARPGTASAPLAWLSRIGCQDAGRKASWITVKNRLWSRGRNVYQPRESEPIASPPGRRPIMALRQFRSGCVGRASVVKVIIVGGGIGGLTTALM